MIENVSAVVRLPSESDTVMVTEPGVMLAGGARPSDALPSP